MARIGTEDFFSGLLKDKRHTDKTAPEGLELSMEELTTRWMNADIIGLNRGKFKLSHRLTWIRGPITGKCLTIDPTDRDNVFEFEYRGDGYFSIKYIGEGCLLYTSPSPRDS